MSRWITGGRGDDDLQGTDRADYVWDRKGDNTINTGAGNDRVWTGRGDDTISTGAGNDVVKDLGGDNLIDTGAGHDWVRTGHGDDTISTGDGCDVVKAGRGDDYVNGGAGNDVVFGGRGADIVAGGSGNDLVFAGRGNDIAVYSMAENGGARDYYNGGSGYDTLTLEFTAAEWAQANVREDVSAYLEVLDSPSWCFPWWFGANFFQFTAFDLTVSRFEALQIVVDGVEVNPGNENPMVTTPLEISLTEGDPSQSIDLLSGASDTDGDSLSVENISGLVDGVSLSGSSLNIDLSHPSFDALGEGETTDITLSYDITDGNGGSVQQTATLTITGQNDVPTVAAAIVVEVNEDAGAVSVDLLSGANDVDGDALAIENITGLADGISVSGTGLDVDLNDPAFQTLGAGETRNITVSYDIVDGQGGLVAQTATLIITGQNDVPTVAAALVVEVTEEAGAAFVDLLSGATDVDGDTLMVENVTGLISGTAVFDNTLDVDLNNPSFQALRDGETTDITLSYDITDGNGGTVQQTATLTVTGQNDVAFIGGVTTGAVSEGGSAVPGQLTISDADAGESGLQAIAAGTDGDNGYGTFEVSSDGSWTYTLDNARPAVQALAAGQEVTDMITVSSVDGTATEVITVTITGQNDAPTVAGPATLSFVEDSGPTIALNLLDGVSDVDEGAVLTVEALSSTLPDDAFALDASSTVLIDPLHPVVQSLGEGEISVVTFTYDVVDEAGGRVTQTFEVTLEGVNDGPVRVAPVTASVIEDDAPEMIDLLAGVVDIDGDADLSVVLTSPLPDGVSLLDPTTLSIDPSDPAFQSLGAGDTTDVVITYQVEDQYGASVEQTATVTVTGTNDAPVIVAQTVEVDAGSSDTIGQLIATDVDTGDSVTWTEGTTTSANGALTVNADGSFSYTPNASFEGVETFTVSATDTEGDTTPQDLRFEVATETYTAPNGQDVDVELSAGAIGDSPFGHMNISLTAYDAPRLNVAFILDSSGSVYDSAYENWLAEVNAVADSIDALHAQFDGTGIDIDVQVINFSGCNLNTDCLLVQHIDANGNGVDELFGSVLDVDVDASTGQAYRDAIDASDFIGRGTYYDIALAQAKTYFDNEFATEGVEFNQVILMTDGRPNARNYGLEERDALLDADTNGYEVDIQAIGIGDGVDFFTLEAYDTDGQPVLLEDFDALGDTSLAASLLPAQLASFSLTLEADGVDQGVIADETSPGVVTTDLNVDLTLADIAGIEDLLGAENEFSLTATFDFDDDLTTTTDQVTLSSFERIALGAEAVTVAGTDGNDLILGSTAGGDDLSGGLGADVILAGDGADTITGGADDDRLGGGSGMDRFIFASGDGADVLSDFDASEDTLAFTGGLTFGDLIIATVGDDVTIAYGSDLITVLGSDVADFGQDVFVFA